MAKTKKKSFLSRILPARFNKAVKTVAHLRLSGPIGTGPSVRPGLALATADKLLEKAFAVKGSAAVAISVNSPGGSPAQSALIHNRIRQLSAEKEVPVIVFCEDVAASGGYMLACAGDEIYAQRFSIIGSIGVISAGFGFVEAIDKLGIERRVYTAGKNKAILDPFQPEKKQDVARLRQIQLEIHDGFIDLVRARRAGKLAESSEDLFTGAFWTAPRAKELGLVDGIGDMHAILSQKFGDEVRIRQIDPSSGFGLRRLFASRSVDGAGKVNLNVTGDFAGDLLSAAESRALWQRFGL